MDNKLYRVRAHLNFFSHTAIKYLQIKDHYFSWGEEWTFGTKLTKEDAETIIRLLRAHSRESHGYELVEVEPAYVITTSNFHKVFYFNGTEGQANVDSVYWVDDIAKVKVSFDKASAIKHQEGLKTLFDTDTELVEYYEHKWDALLRD